MSTGDTPGNLREEWADKFWKQCRVDDVKDLFNFTEKHDLFGRQQMVRAPKVSDKHHTNCDTKEGLERNKLDNKENKKTEKKRKQQCLPKDEQRTNTKL